ncbi:hypothetical protein [Pseudobacteriovorax antillogorgiicola]|uniref:Uncharacterized protein n=1 Tax=Pseudobacteriovorax antillogorgiicola TaxID=1513793 RepID=A0A1Y6CKY6_9BACT|nr:hypothetical protein [Pseudobacteriovorax antillogorgiicola]TCS45425.1 hypothetical protein EDD56_12836 [Pseudobacteriovorax antillogorgiicola]SMF74176.1 hypothetical protein SAMN06296036_12836 [Pseudobacteriovorax antillogorgiicola]
MLCKFKLYIYALFSCLTFSSVAFGASDPDLEGMPLLSMESTKPSEPVASDTLIKLGWKTGVRQMRDKQDVLGSLKTSADAKLGAHASAHWDGELRYQKTSTPSWQDFIHEAAITWRSTHWDLKVGQQRLPWGVMDFTSPSNRQSAQDLSQGVSPSLATLNRGAPAVMVRGTWGGAFAEGFYRPFTTATLLPDEGSPWGQFSPIIRLLPEAKPYAQDERYRGIGGRIGFRLGALGMRLGSYSGYDQWRINDHQALASKPSPLRYHSIDFDVSLGSWVLKGDLAWGEARRYQLNPIGLIESFDDQWLASAIGLDYQWQDFSLVLEGARIEWDQEIESLTKALDSRSTASMAIQQSFLKSDLDIHVIAQYGLDEGDWIKILKLNYKLIDHILFEGGVVDLEGPVDSLAGLYADQDYYYLEIQLAY